MASTCELPLLMGLSPKQLIVLEQRCRLEAERRKLEIERVLTLKFAFMDPHFIKVTTGPFDGRQQCTLFTYWVQHPADTTWTHVHSGLSGFTEGHSLWVEAGGLFVAPTQAQMDKIKGVDAEFRTIYMNFMCNQPRFEEPAK
jgi:hypothetical protein